MSNKHKHADVIKAWADGAEIQYYAEDADRWVDTSMPKWLTFAQYRVKPVKLYKLELELTEAEAFVLACKVNSTPVQAHNAPISMAKFAPNRHLQGISQDLYNKFDFKAMAAAF